MPREGTGVEVGVGGTGVEVGVGDTGVGVEVGVGGTGVEVMVVWEGMFGGVIIVWGDRDNKGGWGGRVN